MEVIVLGYFTDTYKMIRNELKYELYSYISDDNEQDDYNSHAHMVHLFKEII